MLRISRLLAIFLIVSTTFAQSVAPTPQQDQIENKTSLTIPVGTQLRVELENSISSKLNEVGDEVTGTLENSVIVNGIVALEKGAEVRGRITQITKAKRPQRQASMTVVFEKIITPDGEQEISTIIKAIDDYANENKLKADDEGKVKGGRSGQKTVENVIIGGGVASIGGSPAILGGAAAGGLAGAAIAVGAVLGGGALAGVLLTKGKEIRLSPGAVFRVETAKPLTVLVNDSITSTPRPAERPVRRSRGLRGPQ